VSETEDDVAPVRRLFAALAPGEPGLAPRQPRHLRSPARGFPDHRLLLRMIDAIRMTSSDETEFVTNLRRALRLLFRHEHGVDPSDEDSEEIDDIIRKELEFYRYRQTLPPLDGGP
jgi:hypothetical protein